MSLADALIISLIGFAVVFVVLILLSFLIQLESVVLGHFISKPRQMAIIKSAETIKSVDDTQKTSVTAEVYEPVGGGWSAGELRLIGVDEKTAAMIMAIVSHESQIPLSQLQFKTIKAID